MVSLLTCGVTVGAATAVGAFIFGYAVEKDNETPKEKSIKSKTKHDFEQLIEEKKTLFLDIIEQIGEAIKNEGKQLKEKKIAKIDEIEEWILYFERVKKTFDELKNIPSNDDLNRKDFYSYMVRVKEISDEKRTKENKDLSMIKACLSEMKINFVENSICYRRPVFGELVLSHSLPSEPSLLKDHEEEKNKIESLSIKYYLDMQFFNKNMQIAISSFKECNEPFAVQLDACSDAFTKKINAIFFDVLAGEKLNREEIYWIDVLQKLYPDLQEKELLQLKKKEFYIESINNEKSKVLKIISAIGDIKAKEQYLKSLKFQSKEDEKIELVIKRVETEITDLKRKKEIPVLCQDYLNAMVIFSKTTAEILTEDKALDDVTKKELYSYLDETKDQLVLAYHSNFDGINQTIE